LSLLMGKKSPDGAIEIKRHFWKRIALQELTI